MNPSGQRLKSDTVTMEAPRIFALHSRKHGLRNCPSKASQRSRRAWQKHRPAKAAPKRVQHYEPKENMFRHETIVVCSTQKQHSLKDLTGLDASTGACDADEASSTEYNLNEFDHAHSYTIPEDDNESQDDRDEAIKLEGAIVSLKQRMEFDSELMDNALQQASILRTELTQLHDDLHNLCNAFMSDDFDIDSTTNRENVSRISSRKGHRARKFCKKTRTTAQAIIHPLAKSEYCSGGILESTVSAETCGFQEFLAASCLVNARKSFEEHAIVPVPRADDQSTSLIWSEGFDTMLTTDGSVSLSSVCLQSVASNIDDGNMPCTHIPTEGNLDTNFSECALSRHNHGDDCTMEMCDSAASGDELTIVEARGKMGSTGRTELHMLQSGCSEWLSEVCFSSKEGLGACGLDSPVYRDSISKLDSMPIRFDEACFSQSNMHCGTNVHCEKVEVFEHCACDACGESVWSDSNASDDGKLANAAWMDAVEVLPLDSTSRADQSARLLNKSSQSAWDSAKASLERYRPVESLVLPDIEAHAPRVLSGTWDSARQYDISKTVLGDADMCNFSCYDGQVHNLFYRLSGTPSEDILRSCDSAINFENGDGNGQNYDDTPKLKVSAPSTTENKLKSTKVRKGLGKGIGIENSCNTSSYCNANMLPCSVDKGEHASSILSGGNKCESKCSSSAGRWFDRVYQGFSSIANGIGINGVAAEDTVVSGKTNCNEFELVEMNGGVEWEQTGLNDLKSHSKSLRMVCSTSMSVLHNHLVSNRTQDLLFIVVSTVKIGTILILFVKCIFCRNCPV